MYIVRETLESAALAAAVVNATDADRDARRRDATDCWKELWQRTIRRPTTARADTSTSA